MTSIGHAHPYGIVPKQRSKFCPFCGSMDLELRGCDAPFYVACNSCGAEGPMANSEEEAIAGWDNRYRAGDL
jgi:Lar family restriction alleviation protein